MKLYHFNPNNYDNEYYVMASSRENAINALLNHIKTRIEENEKAHPGYDDWFNRCKLQFFENWLLKNGNSNEYTLDEYNENNVIESEVA